MRQGSLTQEPEAYKEYSQEASQSRNECMTRKSHQGHCWDNRKNRETPYKWAGNIEGDQQGPKSIKTY